MITTQEEYDNCKAQIARQKEEIRNLQDVVDSVQAQVDEVEKYYEPQEGQV